MREVQEEEAAEAGAAWEDNEEEEGEEDDEEDEDEDEEEDDEDEDEMEWEQDWEDEEEDVPRSPANFEINRRYACPWERRYARIHDDDEDTDSEQDSDHATYSEEGYSSDADSLEEELAPDRYDYMMHEYFPPEDLCTACRENPANMALIPCGHSAYCLECLQSAKQAGLAGCPLCRREIREAKRR